MTRARQRRRGAVAARAAWSASRAQGGTLGNAALDEFLAGRVDRRTVLRYASAMGLSSFAGAVRQALAAEDAAASSGLEPHAGASHGSAPHVPPSPDAAAPPAARPPPEARSDLTVRVASLTPVGAIDPLTASDPATIALLSQTCEYLIADDGDRQLLLPSLALTWAPDATAQVWTFRLRKGVRFHDGQMLTAADVVASFERLTDPQAGSAALPVFRGVLSKGGTRALDEATVVFRLDAPNASFPYYVSSDNYNACILPARRIAAGAPAFETDFIGTGPFRLAGYTPRRGATFVRNEHYWGAPARPAQVAFSFYADQQSQILALQGRDADVVMNFSVQGGRALLDNPRYRVQSVRSSSHRQMHMRCDAGPYADARIRQALALSIDRQAIVSGFFLNRAQLGNDSPFAPVFPTSPTSLPQRRHDPMRARALLTAVAAERGMTTVALCRTLSTTLVTEKFMEMPDYAVLVQSAARSIGIDLPLRVESQASYYGAGVRGRSDWLDATLGITDYGHRGVPNVFLDAPLSSHGAWNAARFRDARYDDLLARYSAALDLASQRRLAQDLGALLLEQTPVIISYFFDAMIAMRADLHEVRFTAITQLALANAWIDP